MNIPGRLGNLYNLSPATVAGLANVSGLTPWEQEQHAQEDAANAADPAPLNAANKDLAAQPIGPPVSLAPAGVPGSQENAKDPNTGLPVTKPKGILERALDTVRYGASPAAPEAPGVTKGPEDVALHRPGETAEDAAIRQARERDAQLAAQAVDDQRRALQARAGGVGVIPAHWQPGSHQVTLQRGMNPDELAPGMSAKDDDAQYEVDAAQKHYEAAQYKGSADALYAASHAFVAQQANQQIKDNEIAKADYVAKEQKKFDELSAAAQREVDPDQYWKQKGTGATIAAAIAMGLGQFATMWSGRGTNAAMDLLNKAVDDNIKAQTANIAKSQRALEQHQSLFDKNLAVFGDKERAILATKAQYLDEAAARVEGIRINANDADAQAAKSEMLGKIQLQRAQQLDEFSKLTHTQANETMNEQFHAAAAVGGAHPEIGMKGLENLYVPELGGYARSPEEAAGLRKQGATTQVLVGALTKAQGIIDKAKNTNNPLELHQLQKDLDALRAQTTIKSAVEEGQRASNEGIREMAETMNGLADASVWRLNGQLGHTSERIGSAIKSSQQEFGRNTPNIRRGTEIYVRDEKGNVVPRAVLFGNNPAARNATDNLDDKSQGPKGDVQK